MDCGRNVSQTKSEFLSASQIRVAAMIKTTFFPCGNIFFYIRDVGEIYGDRSTKGCDLETRASAFPCVEGPRSRVTWTIFTRGSIQIQEGGDYDNDESRKFSWSFTIATKCPISLSSLLPYNLFNGMIAKFVQGRCFDRFNNEPGE